MNKLAYRQKRNAQQREYYQRQRDWQARKYNTERYHCSLPHIGNACEERIIIDEIIENPEN